MIGKYVSWMVTLPLMGGVSYGCSSHESGGPMLPVGREGMLIDGRAIVCAAVALTLTRATMRVMRYMMFRWNEGL